MIAYAFPPEGRAGTFRPLRFVRYLSKMGWGTSIISCKPYRYERYDPDLLAMVPKETEIIRVRGCDPWQAFQAWREKRVKRRLSGGPVEMVDQIREAQYAPFRSRVREALHTAERFFYLPDMAKPWIRPAVEATVDACTRKQPNVIWATVGPVSSGVVAQRASERTGLPYVLDFRDPWGLNYYEEEVKRSRWAAGVAHRIMYGILERAQAVVFLFRTIAECYLRAYHGALDPAKVHIIPNGYEGSLEDFNPPDGGRCTIFYAGNLSTYRYDTLLLGLRSLKQTDPVLAERLRLFFVGDGMEKIAREVRTLGLSDIVETMGPVPYAEILRLQGDAHSFLILGRNPNRKGHELVAGAKLFGYLKGRRPIFGVLPRDETAKILYRVGARTVANADSVSDIVTVLRRILDAWSEGTLPSLLPDRAACEVYSSEHQTLALIRALEGQPPTEPFISGSIEVPVSLRGDLVTRSETGLSVASSRIQKLS